VGGGHPPGGEARAGRRADRGRTEEPLEGQALPLHPVERRRVQLGHPRAQRPGSLVVRSEEHTSELQSRFELVCRLLLEKKKIPTVMAPVDRIRTMRTREGRLKRRSDNAERTGETCRVGVKCNIGKNRNTQSDTDGRRMR